MARDRPSWSRLAHAELSSAAVALAPSALPPELCTLIGDANRAAVERALAPAASHAERVVAEMHDAFYCFSCDLGPAAHLCHDLRTSDFRMSASCACCRQWPWKCECDSSLDHNFEHISDLFEPWQRRSRALAGPHF